MGVFAQHAPTYAAAGLPAFPVDTRNKRPSVRNWQRAGLRATRAWLEKFGDADGLGIVMGPRTGITEIDVDIVGDAALAAALDRFGETPLTIRTPGGKSKAWYRYSGESRRIRPFGDLPIDVLGAGFTVAPPSYRADLGRDYRFLTGSLAELNRLPPIRTDALGSGDSRAAASVREGERNHVLFRWCMVHARYCDDVDALIDAAQTWVSAMPVPLDSREVERTARSAWSFEVDGRNFVGLRRPQVTWRDKAMDNLMDEPDAFVLLQIFERYHRNRPNFVISPTAMSRDKNPPWHRSRIEHARDVLIERGYIAVVRPPDGRQRRPGYYKLTMPDSGNNHITLSLPALGQERGWAAA